MGKPSESEDYIDPDPPVPLFDKRLFATHGLVLVTSAARSIMAQRAGIRPDQPMPRLTRAEMHALRCVVDGLRVIHKDHRHVREVLSHVISLEEYDANQFVEKKDWEEELSCYYVISGSVKVNYNQVGIHRTLDAHQPDIEYNHGPGEILGVVSPVGIQDDLSPPSSVLTKEPTVLLRIDRQRFHSLIIEYNQALTLEKKNFLEDPRCILSAVPEHAIDKILPHVTKLELPANKTVVRQGTLSDDMYFVMSGRCELTRDVHIPEIGKSLTFTLGTREPYSYFAEECLVSSSTAHCTATTATVSVFLMISRTALEVVLKEHLWAHLADNLSEFPDDKSLQNLGYTTSVWNAFKQSEVQRYFSSIGKDYRMLPWRLVKVQKRPMVDQLQYQENLLRFTQHGSNFERVTNRISSAYCRRPTKSASTTQRRPNTARSRLVSGLSHRKSETAESSATSCLTVTETDTMSSGQQSGTTSGNVSTSSFGSTRTNAPTNQDESDYTDVGDDDVFVSRSASQDKGSTSTGASRQPSTKTDTDMGEEKHEFTKSSLFLTMKTSDIVRKAKALAEKKTMRAESTVEEEEDEEEIWYTSLHEENERARTTVYANRYRSAFLRRRMTALEKRLEVQEKKRQRQRDTRSPHPELRDIEDANKAEAEGEKQFRKMSILAETEHLSDAMEGTTADSFEWTDQHPNDLHESPQVDRLDILENGQLQMRRHSHTENNNLGLSNLPQVQTVSDGPVIQTVSKGDCYKRRIIIVDQERRKSFGTWTSQDGSDRPEMTRTVPGMARPTSGNFRGQTEARGVKSKPSTKPKVLLVPTAMQERTLPKVKGKVTKTQPTSTAVVPTVTRCSRFTVKLKQ